ncbi:hypothetical protein L1987_01462 [Smallanthus sonchifolius]|uniref:Uncharacterized protein n=1 Tax=Smallanthus sonchifolius TaxID=185202 RepID=A0ACB9K5B2_9ASTR|nr:hypothetical protein L1987_01462 [Smallanthus sonchifolius]
MKAAQDRQKSYADKRRRPIEFDVGDRIMLKVSPWKGIIRFRKRGKLSLRFVGPFRIMARVGEVAYRLELPDELSGIHPTFHVSHLRKCLADESARVPLTDIEVDNSLNYIEEPVAILDRKEKRPKAKVRVFVRKLFVCTYQVRMKQIESDVVGPLFRTTQISLYSNEGYGYGKYVMGLYLLGAFVAGQLLYNWGDDSHQGDYRDP